MGPVVIIGANGQLGSDLCRQGHALGQGVVPLTRSQVDLRDHSAVDSLLNSIAPEVIVNTAAFHKLEACEADVEQTFAVNSFAVRNLAQGSDRIGASDSQRELTDARLLVRGITAKIFLPTRQMPEHRTTWRQGISTSYRYFFADAGGGCGDPDEMAPHE